MNRNILRLPSVAAQTGLSRSTIYLRIKEGSFPPPFAIGQRAVGWDSTEIDHWVDTQVAQGRIERQARQGRQGGDNP